MLPPPEKLTLEVEVDNLFHNGDKKNVARLIQRDASTVSRQLSPNCEHNNHVVYFFILVLWALDNIRQSLGDAVIQIVLRERSKWLDDAPVIECDADLAENVGIQFSEFVACRMRNKDYDEQIKEAGDIEVAAARLKANLIRERNSVLYGGSARETGRAIVTAHKNGRPK